MIFKIHGFSHHACSWRMERSTGDNDAIMVFFSFRCSWRKIDGLVADFWDYGTGEEASG
jgi:hypothetical protein